MLAGDLDEDGREDVLVAMPGSSLASYRAGAVLLYPGTATGIEPGSVAFVGAGARLAIGASRGSGDEGQEGAAYVLDP